MQKRKISPYLLVLLSFACVILLGSILLILPWSYQKTWLENHNPVYWDSLMLSTSAVCVTGLTPYADISATLSVFGKIVLLLLVQIGGLGFITIFTFFLSLFGVKIGAINRFMIKEALNLKHFSGITKFIKKIILYTAVVEGIGLLLNLIVFVPEFGFGEGLWISLFHSVSSFNNAGFDILGSTSLIRYSHDILLNITTMLLIIIGGIGFPVIDDMLHHSPRRWSPYTKIVLITSSFFIVVGTLSLWLFERPNQMTFLEALFQSVSARTAGFATVDMSQMTMPGTIIMEILMFIGASPLSTGGGIKTTTVFVIVISILFFIKGKKPVIFHRALSRNSTTKAMALTFIAMSVLLLSFFTMVLIEEKNPSIGNNADGILFEGFSALGTVGLSKGLTPYFYPGSKVVLCLLMFFGRVGPITILSVFSKTLNQEEESHVRYIEDNIVIG